MKKLFLTLIAVVATSLAGFSQITLIDAYSSLAQLPGMKSSSAKTVQIDSSSSITDATTATVKAKDVVNTRNQFYYMIESLPVRNVLVSANNQRELATVFAQPAGNGLYSVLVLTGSVQTGEYSATYGFTDKAGIDAIGNSQVSMDSQELSITPTPGGSDNFISWVQ
jgi:hypothetical protein